AVLGAFSAAGDFTLVDAHAGTVDITGLVDAGSNTIALTTNNGGLAEAPGGMIDPGALVVVSAGPVTLGNANTVASLAATVGGAGAGFLFNNTAVNLTIATVDGVAGVTTNDGAITLQTTGFGNLSLTAPVNAGAGDVTLNISGTIGQTGAGTIAAGGLSGVSIGGANLGGSNLVSTLGLFGNIGGG